MTNVLAPVFSIAFAAGLNAYATVLALGVMQRMGWIHLPAGLDVLGSTTVLVAAAGLYMVEFVADKVPYFDSIWDGLHTVIRPAAGAFLAYGFAASVDPSWQVVAALVGGGVAFTSHAAKATTRAAANVSPEPFSNWILSLTEDAISFGLVWLTATHPTIALAIAVVLVAIAVYIIWRLWRFARRLFSRKK